MKLYFSGLLAAVALTLAGLALPSLAANNNVTAPSQSQLAQPAAQPASSVANDALLASIKANFEKRFPGLQISGVKPTPFKGLYEVQIGMDLVYADADVNFLLQGSLIDAQSRQDLTAARLAKLSEVGFDTLPLDLAIKQVKGTGQHKMAVFEDPNCGYCKLFHKTLKGIDNTTVYTFLFPILSADSEAKARNVWCAKDQAKTWADWMNDGKVPANAECSTPIDKILALGRKLMVQGTPAIIFADGSRVNGALPLEALKTKLAGIK